MSNLFYCSLTLISNFYPKSLKISKNEILANLHQIQNQNQCLDPSAAGLQAWAGLADIQVVVGGITGKTTLTPSCLGSF